MKHLGSIICGGGVGVGVGVGGWTGSGEGVFCGVFINEPVVSFNPNAYKSIAVIMVISINGINTIIQEIMPKPPWHNRFNKNPMMDITINFINAVLYSPFIRSIMICVNENTI
jgi:hypothetical protein